jgi:hypothetical protein
MRLRGRRRLTGIYADRVLRREARRLIVRRLKAAVHESVLGPSRQLVVTRHSVAIGPYQTWFEFPDERDVAHRLTQGW